ncbi:YpfB family protein [Bacillus timonensis]|nr:YpfB family protein [Bacillus timonensis]
MKRFERVLIKLVFIQFVFLIVAQLLLLYSPFTPFLTKVIDYEGVNKQEQTKTIETLLNQ